MPGEGEGGGGGFLPVEIIQLLEDSGRDGIVISGLVTWMIAQIGTHAVDIWQPLAERCFSYVEVTAAKDALVKAGGVALKGHPNIKNRNGGNVNPKKETEIDDIKKIILFLRDEGKMPLVLASSDQMTRCPQSWGIPTVPTTQDMVGKIAELEKAMSDNMESQREQMHLVRSELAALRSGGPPRTPTFPRITLDKPETPNTKKRKFDLSQTQQESMEMSYSQVLGVEPLTQKREKNQKLTMKTKTQKNIYALEQKRQTLSSLLM